MTREWISAALEGTGWTFDEVMAGVDAGWFYLFENDSAAMVGEIIVSPRHKVMHIWAAGGEMTALKSLVPIAEQFGISKGCDSGGATGRMGWVRALRDLGYVAATPAVEKEL